MEPGKSGINGKSIPPGNMLVPIMAPSICLASGISMPNQTSVCTEPCFSFLQSKMDSYWGGGWNSVSNKKLKTAVLLKNLVKLITASYCFFTIVV